MLKQQFTSLGQLKLVDQFISFWTFVRQLNATVQVTQRHYIFIKDVSGSMDGAIEQVKHDCIEICKTCKTGTMTFILFNHNTTWVLGSTMPQLVLDSSNPMFQQYVTLITSKMRASGCTNISKPALSIISECYIPSALAIGNFPFEIYLFTDGNDNCTQGGNRAVVNAYKDLAAHITGLGATYFARLLAYGDWADVNLLNTIASEIGGTVTFCSTANQLGESIIKSIESSQNSIRTEVDIPIDGSTDVFAFDSDSHNIISFVPNTQIVVPTDNFIFVSMKNDGRVVNKASLDTPIFYLVAARLLQKGQKAKALDLLADQKEVYFYDLLMSAISPADYGRCINELIDAFVNEDKRYLNGSHFDAKSKKTTRVDLLMRLTKSKGLMYALPRSYSNITVRNEKVTKDPEGNDFVEPELIEDNDFVPFPKDINFNEKTASVQLQGHRKYKMRIKQEHLVLNPSLRGEYILDEFKDRAIIGPAGQATWFNKKGLYAIDITNVDAELFEFLKDNRLVPHNRRYSPTEVYTINLSKLPVSFRTSEQLTSSEYGKLYAKTQLIKTEMAFYNKVKDELIPSETAAKEGDVNAEFLKDYYRISNTGSLSSKTITPSIETIKTVLEILGKVYETDTPILNKDGGIIPLESLTVENVNEVLYNLRFIDSKDAYNFDHDLQLVGLIKKGTPKETSKDFSFHASNYKTPTKLFESFKLDKESVVEVLREKLVDIETIENPTLKLAAKVAKEYFDFSVDKTKNQIVRYIQDKIEELTQLQFDIQIEMLGYRIAIGLSGGTFSDQPLTEDAKQVEFGYAGYNFKYTPKLSRKIVYCGDARDLIIRAKESVS